MVTVKSNRSSRKWTALRIGQLLLTIPLISSTSVFLGLAILEAFVLHAIGVMFSRTIGSQDFLVVNFALFALTLVFRPANRRAGLFLAALILTALLSAVAVSLDYPGLITLTAAGIFLGLGSLIGNRRQGLQAPKAVLALAGLAVVLGAGLFPFELAARPPVVAGLSAVASVDARHAWVTGEDGIILATSDGGAHWSRQSSGTTTWLNSVCFVDLCYGWAVGEDGTLLSTSDGGVHWRATRPLPSGELWDIAFLTRELGWAAGSKGIYHTTDSGATWILQKPIEAVSEIGFSDALHGWAAGIKGTVFATDDGGQTWVRKQTGAREDLSAVSCAGAKNAWVLSDDYRVLRTTDGGATWTTVLNKPNDFKPLEMAFVGSLRGWLLCSGRTILATDDGGEHWSAQKTGTRVWFNDIAFADEQHGWAVGNRGTIIGTADGGRTWKVQMTGTKWQF